MGFKESDMPWMTCTCNDNAAETFVPATDWVDAGSITAVNAYGEARNKSNSQIQWAPALQTATDPRSPDTHVKLKSLTTTVGVIDPGTTNTSVTGGAKRVIRGGWALQNTTDTTLGAVALRGRIRWITD